MPRTVQGVHYIQFFYVRKDKPFVPYIVQGV